MTLVNRQKTDNISIKAKKNVSTNEPWNEKWNNRVDIKMIALHIIINTYWAVL